MVYSCMFLFSVKRIKVNWTLHTATGGLEVPYVEFHYNLSEGSKDIVEDPESKQGLKINEAESKWLDWMYCRFSIPNLAHL
jgi:hypothetical protein